MIAPGIERSRRLAEEDSALEAVVLQQVLALHPTQLSLEELARALGDGEDFARRDAVGRAVAELAAAGLLHRNGELLTPSRAALRFGELLGD